jgi:hypothetical protein
VATIYLSSTFRDLEAHRKAVNDQLTKMRHKVIAMESYVAREDRPFKALVSVVRTGFMGDR